MLGEFSLRAIPFVRVKPPVGDGQVRLVSGFQPERTDEMGALGSSGGRKLGELTSAVAQLCIGTNSWSLWSKSVRRAPMVAWVLPLNGSALRLLLGWGFSS
jgi:hypothetical protein